MSNSPVIFELEGKLTFDRIKYWMEFAKHVEDSENPCYSRKIGVVIIDPMTDNLVSIGHNGPPKGNPPCDDRQYLRSVVLPQLTTEEKNFAFEYMCGENKWLLSDCGDWFPSYFGNCKQCPRRLINAPSGKRLELCSCAHAEHNAIVQAHRSVVGFWIICHCGVPCVECCKTIINSGIKNVVCLKRNIDYSPYSSRWILEKSGVKLVVLDGDFE